MAEFFSLEDARVAYLQPHKHKCTVTSCNNAPVALLHIEDGTEDVLDRDAMGFTTQLCVTHLHEFKTQVMRAFNLAHGA